MPSPDKIYTKTFVEVRYADGTWLSLDYEGLNYEAHAREIYQKLTGAGVPARLRKQHLVTETVEMNVFARLDEEQPHAQD